MPSSDFISTPMWKTWSAPVSIGHEAERRARLEFGAIEATKDECRQAWGLQWMDELRADLRLTFRTLRRNPGFAAIAILSLALGIGANTAIFGLMDAVMLRLLPVRDPGRLVFVQTAGTAGRDGPPYPFFELLRDQARSFEAIAAFSASNMELAIDGGREQARGVWVSGNFYQMLGVAPVIGRTLAASDDQTPGKGGPDGAVAVISRAYWQQRFGGDPAVVGRTVHMMFDFEHTVTIVGVMPSEIMSLEPGRPIDIAVPMMLSDPVKLRDRIVVVAGHCRAAEARRARGTGPRGIQRAVPGIHGRRPDSAGGPQAAVRSHGTHARREGPGRPAHAVFATAHRDDDSGRPGPAGRLRERGQPDARPGDGAAKGIRRPPGDWRGTRPADSPDPDGSAGAGRIGRRRWEFCSHARAKPPWLRFSPKAKQDRARSVAERTHAAVHAHRRSAERSGVRITAGACGRRASIPPPDSRAGREASPEAASRCGSAARW